jgi:hypothetical protein
MVQVMPPHLTARQHMVLAAIDDIECDAQALHQRRTGPTQIVRSPGTIFAVVEYECIVVSPVLHGLGRSTVLAALEHRLAVANLLAHRLFTHMSLSVFCRKTPLSMPRHPLSMPRHLLKLTELVERKRGQIDGEVLQLALDVFARNEPLPRFEIDMIFISVCCFVLVNFSCREVISRYPISLLLLTFANFCSIGSSQHDVGKILVRIFSRIGSLVTYGADQQKNRNSLIIICFL